MTLARTVSTLASVVVVALLAGCSGKTIGDDINSHPDPTVPTPDAGPNPGCAGIAPACDPNDQEFGTEASCNAAGADYCYSRSTSCGNGLVWCGHKTVSQCAAVPTCDPGDTQLMGACPAPVPGEPPAGGGSGITCYARTLCGSTIACQHRDACKALPACNPGDVEVVDIDTCSKPGVSCYSRTECNFTIHCYTP